MGVITIADINHAPSQCCELKVRDTLPRAYSLKLTQRIKVQTVLMSPELMTVFNPASVRFSELSPLAKQKIAFNYFFSLKSRVENFVIQFILASLCLP
jgi:hypothetical protein